MKEYIRGLGIAIILASCGGSGNEVALSDFAGTWVYIGGSSRLECPDESGDTESLAGSIIEYRIEGDRVVASLPGDTEGGFVYQLEGNRLVSDGAQSTTETIQEGPAEGATRTLTQDSMIFTLRKGAGDPREDQITANGSGTIQIEGFEGTCTYTLEGLLERSSGAPTTAGENELTVAKSPPCEQGECEAVSILGPTSCTELNETAEADMNSITPEEREEMGDDICLVLHNLDDGGSVSVCQLDGEYLVVELRNGSDDILCGWIEEAGLDALD